MYNASIARYVAATVPDRMNVHCPWLRVQMSVTHVGVGMRFSLEESFHSRRMHRNYGDAESEPCFSEVGKANHEGDVAQRLDLSADPWRRRRNAACARKLSSHDTSWGLLVLYFHGELRLRKVETRVALMATEGLPPSYTKVSTVGFERPTG